MYVHQLWCLASCWQKHMKTDLCTNLSPKVHMGCIKIYLRILERLIDPFHWKKSTTAFVDSLQAPAGRIMPTISAMHQFTPFLIKFIRIFLMINVKIVDVCHCTYFDRPWSCSWRVVASSAANIRKWPSSRKCCIST